MAVTKKSIEEIARENALDISEANAERVANAYIQPTLDALTRAEQVAVADAQSARKALEADYFNQYRENMYNSIFRIICICFCINVIFITNYKCI